MSSRCRISLALFHQIRSDPTEGKFCELDEIRVDGDFLLFRVCERQKGGRHLWAIDFRWTTFSDRVRFKYSDIEQIYMNATASVSSDYYSYSHTPR